MQLHANDQKQLPQSVSRPLNKTNKLTNWLQNKPVVFIKVSIVVIASVLTNCQTLMDGQLKSNVTHMIRIVTSTVMGARQGEKLS